MSRDPPATIQPKTVRSATIPRLVLRGITKRYPPVVANDRVDLEVAAGEIHALLGENGAGKSTLMKIVYGLTQPDEGVIEWEGAQVILRNPAQARRLGIAMVFQQFCVFETLTVAQNIALALEARLPAATLAARIHAISGQYGLPLDPAQPIHSMSVGERQRVEIVRCLLQSPRLLIMDEPTSVLTPQARPALFETLRRLAAEGLSILYISHRLDEIRALCDVATVLRAGRVSGRVIPRGQTDESLARLMLGTGMPARRLPPREPGAIELELTNLSLQAEDSFGASLQQINLRVRGGEIVGIAGVAGNGQQELLAALSGESPVGQSGAVRIGGQSAGLLGPAQRRDLDLAFVPAERLDRGSVAQMRLDENALLTGWTAGLVRRGVVQGNAARHFARAIIRQFDVKCSSELALAGSLSGGNLQKFIVGREIHLGPRVLLLAQPTWGLDVGAAQRIHEALFELRSGGIAVLVVSEDLDELLAICDRLAVLARGRLSPTRAVGAIPIGTIGRWMNGDFEADAPPQQAEHAEV